MLYASVGLLQEHFLDQLQKTVNRGYGLVYGGLECTKKEISKVVDEEIAHNVEELRDFKILLSVVYFLYLIKAKNSMQQV